MTKRKKLPKIPIVHGDFATDLAILQRKFARQCRNQDRRGKYLHRHKTHSRRQHLLRAPLPVRRLAVILGDRMKVELTYAVK